MSDLDRWTERAAEALIPWSPRGPDQARWRNEAARAVLAAVLPDIRRDVAEEIAQAIEEHEGGDRCVVEVTSRHGTGTFCLSAPDIAREIGEAK